MRSFAGWSYKRHAPSHDHVTALRFVLAALSEDEEAFNLMIGELGECQTCYRNVIAELAEMAAVYMAEWFQRRRWPQLEGSTP